MMFLFGGIPNIYYNRLIERAAKELAGDNFTGLPLHPTGQSYVLNSVYCRELIKTLVAYIEERPNCLDNGLGVVLLRREWEKAQVEESFWPFALVKSTLVSGHISRSGEGARRSANHYAADAIATAASLRKSIRAMTVEFEARLRRTPLLLPLRHFGKPDIENLLIETSVAAKNTQNPTEAILQACKRFEDQFPYQRTGRRRGGFENRRNIRFETPTRDGFHGKRAAQLANPHNEACFLNSRLRLGGFFVDGFHFDCTARGGAHSGRFENCHDREDIYEGRPHLNVYPNDFIR